MDEVNSALPRRAVTIWALLLATHLTVLQVIHILWTGGVALTLETAARVISVPTGQLLALKAWDFATHSSRPTGKDDALKRFFGACAVLAVALAVTSTTVQFLVTRQVDLTVAALLLLLSTPPVQSAVLAWPKGHARRFLAQLRVVMAHPLVRPAVWIDAVILPIGWVLVDHPLVGAAAAGPIQRRWMGTKLIAAGAFCLTSGLRTGAWHDPSRGHAALVAAGIALAGLGLECFFPWIHLSAELLPDPIPAQPPVLLWLEAHAVALVAIIWTALNARTALAGRSVEASAVFAAGIVTLFVGALSVGMNGFLGLQPAYPWAGLAVTTGSIAATLFLAGALAASRPGLDGKPASS